MGTRRVISTYNGGLISNEEIRLLRIAALRLWSGVPLKPYLTHLQHSPQTRSSIRLQNYRSRMLGGCIASSSSSELQIRTSWLCWVHADEGAWRDGIKALPRETCWWRRAVPGRYAWCMP